MKNRPLIWLATLTTLAACSNSTGVESGSPQISLSFAATSPAPATSVAADVIVNDGQNTLVITRAEVVLREVELWRLGALACDEAAGVDDCQKFQTGAMLLDVPMDGSVSQAVSIAIEPGTFNRVEFDIHKVSDGPDDAAFRSAHPDLLDTSIRVRGQYNGADFTFISDLNESQRFDLVPALVIDETTVSTNVTVRLDLDAWFRDPNGAVLNPTTANRGEANENLVRDNIRSSIEAFEDADRSGRSN